MSEDALTDLESAVGFANAVNKRIQDGPQEESDKQETNTEAKSLPDEPPAAPVEVSA